MEGNVHLISHVGNPGISSNIWDDAWSRLAETSSWTWRTKHKMSQEKSDVFADKTCGLEHKEESSSGKKCERISTHNWLCLARCTLRLFQQFCLTTN